MAAALVDDDHPLALELVSLRNAVARYQHEAHAASVKLQRHSLDTSHALERAHVLQSENAQLKEELAVLRAHPEAPPHPASLQVQELTIAHRRLSDKLTLTEETLLGRNVDLAHARSDLSKAQHDMNAAHELAARTRTQLQEAQVRERELGRKARAAEEERKLADLVVQEYADLVRTLEGRPRPSVSSPSTYTLGSTSNNSTSTLVDSLSEGKSGLQKLLEEFNGETERLEVEINKLHGEAGLLSAQLDAERKRAEHDRVQLAESQTELQKYRIDDNAAAKMVSRYMKFSQSSTDSLQKAMEGMKARYEATSATLRTEIEHLQKSLVFERRQSETLRHALDELTEDISREAYGRRREISLRLAFLGREENLAEGLRRWIRRARESFERTVSTADNHDLTLAIRRVFEAVIRDADGLLESLNGPPSAEEASIGSVARVIAAQNTVSALTHELQVETDRRLQLERELAQNHVSHEPPLRAVSLAELPPPPPQTIPNGDSHKSTVDEARHVVAAISAPPSPPRTDLVNAEVLYGSSQKTPARDTAHKARTPSLEVQVSDIYSEAQALDKSAEEMTRPEASTKTTNTVVDTVDVPAAAALENDTVSTAKTVSPDLQDQVSESGPTETRTEEAASIAELAEPSIVTSVDSSRQPFPLLPAEASSDGISIHSPSVDMSYVLGQSLEVQITPAIEVHSSDKVASPVDQLPSVAADVFSPISASPLDELRISPLTSQLLNGHSQSSAPPKEYPLLPELLRVKQRYDTLQRGFRDCHLALKEMKKDLSTLPHASDMPIILQKAVERLDDFNEDARVELEIRITDEARMISGYEALLTIPGAMSDEVDQGEMEAEIKAFVEGTDKAVAKAVHLFTRKLDDLEHDVAAVKRALHELSASVDDPPSGTTPAKNSPSWTSWTAGLLAPSRPISPAPTFGSVMTSPRLRQTSLSHPRKASDDSPGSGQDPFASLELRIPMPSHIVPTSPPTRATPRPRVSSATYMLGLGARNHSFGLSALPAKPAPISRLASSSGQSAINDAEDGDENLDSDVE